MLFKLIDFKYFLISLSVGLLYIYISNEYQKVIVLYPNPHNLNKYTYVDKANNCFNYDLKETKCPHDPEKYVNVNVSY
tara:strand:+ start:254 stop:487 length:234 start_codon:yes stop_codon:yes gene_type:complete